MPPVIHSSTCKQKNTSNNKKVYFSKGGIFIWRGGGRQCLWSSVPLTAGEEAPWSSLQCRRFLWAHNLLAKAPCWNFPKRGGNGANQREWGGGGEREEKTPARKHCENEKHPLLRRAWPLFRKWVADNNKTTKQSLQSKDSHCLEKQAVFLSWLSRNAILHSWWSFSLSCNSFF